MANNIEGLFFENQILTAKGLGAFGAASLSDGILTGCDVTVSGLAVTISPGWIIVCGRPAYVSTAQTFTASSRYNIIKAAVDTTATATEDAFNQVTLSLETNASLSTLMTNNIASGRAEPTAHGSQEHFVYTHDINMTGSTASTWLVEFEAVLGTVGSIHYNYSVSKSMIELWRNSSALKDSSTSSFAAQTLTIPEIIAYNALLIVYRGYSSNPYNNDYGIPLASMICPYWPTSSQKFTYNLMYPYVSQNYNDLTNMRLVHIVGSAGTVEFENGWYAGTSSSYGESAYRCIPAVIYGLKQW